MTFVPAASRSETPSNTLPAESASAPSSMRSRLYWANGTALAADRFLANSVSAGEPRQSVPAPSFQTVPARQSGDFSVSVAPASTTTCGADSNVTPRFGAETVTSFVTTSRQAPPKRN